MNDSFIVTIVNTGELPAEALDAQSFLETLKLSLGLANAQVEEKNGLYCFEHSETVDGITMYYLGILHKGNNNNFYFTLFIAETDILDIAWTYINTITITPEA